MWSANNENESESEVKCNNEIQHGLLTEAQVHSMYEPFIDRASFHIPT